MTKYETLDCAASGGLCRAEHHGRTHQKADATNQDRSYKPMIQGLMMHEQLTISQLLDHAAENHSERQIACFAGAQPVRYDYATLRDRVSRLVGVLRRLGVSQGDRVASLAWN